MRAFLHRSLLLPTLFVIGQVAAGCGADASKGDGPALNPGTDATTNDETSVDQETGTDPDSGTGLNTDASLPATDAPVVMGCIAADDCDGDGYKTADDCNDKDGTINPNAYDFLEDMIDNDCDGTVDNPVAACAPTDLATDDPTSFARVADLCPQVKLTATGKPFDPVVKAEWGTVTANGSKPFLIGTQSVGSVTLAHVPAAVKMLDKFGNNEARTGGSMNLLSTGPTIATDPRGPGATSTRWMTKKSGAEVFLDDGCAALKLDANDCKQLTAGTPSATKVRVTDLTELKLTLQAPSNAKAMSFDFAFLSTEFNEFHKTSFNDAFFAIVNNKAIAGKNVAKDANGNALTVNSGFFQLCPKAPGPAGIAKAAALANCAGVDGDATKLIFGTLGGTYFDGAGLTPPSTDDTVVSFLDKKKYIYGGGSGWLTTKFGVEPGETFTIRLFVVDAGDGILDSAVLIDNVKWEKAPPKVVTGEVDRPPR